MGSDHPESVYDLATKRKGVPLAVEQYPAALLELFCTHYGTGGQRFLNADDCNEYLKLRCQQIPSLAATLSAIALMQERGWIDRSAAGGLVWVLRSQGIEYFQWLMRPWYIKMWDFMKGDVRTVVVAVVTAIVGAVVTTLALRALGWIDGKGG